MAKIASSLASKVELQDGVIMPMFGIGVYKAGPGDGKGCESSVKFAINHGYKLVDTAQFYRNEKDVGRGIVGSGVDRKDLFLVTKLQWSHHGKEKTKQAFHDSLKRLGTDYVDLYLIHSPNGGQLLDTYDALLELQKERLIRSVGVSNFDVQHIEGLLKSGRPAPSVNQVELHVFQRKPELVKYCRENNIAVMGYAPLAKAKRMDDPVVTSMARKYGRSVAQVMIRWSVQSGFITIPKSVREERIVENAQVFDWTLTPEDYSTLSTLPTFCCLSSSSPPTSWDELS